MDFAQLVQQYVAAGVANPREEAAREVRMTTGDIYFGRTDAEVAEMHRQEAAMYAQARRSAGVCEEFPAGEFAVPGYNC